MSKIRVAIVGVGNCAKSLVEGVALYTATQRTDGLAFPLIGGYGPKDIEFVLAYDVDKRKVGRHLSEAIYARPNCAMDLLPHSHRHQHLARVIPSAMPVRMGAVMDGVADHMSEYPEEESFRLANHDEPNFNDIVHELKTYKVDVLLNYLPVGSTHATEFYLNAALQAKVPFVNCIPVFAVSTRRWHQNLINAGIPAIGDDMRSQLGASVMSQMLQELFFNRGMHVEFHEQVNHGGNTDFLNMMDQSRLASKKISKENVIRAQNDIRHIPVPRNGIFAGPSTYIPYHGDNKIAHIHIEGEGFGGAPVVLDMKLSVQDSPNSAGVVIDAIRYLQVAREMGMYGALHGPSAFTQKTPPVQMMFQDAYMECKLLSERKWSNLTKTHNRPSTRLTFEPESIKELV